MKSVSSCDSLFPLCLCKGFIVPQVAKAGGNMITCPLPQAVPRQGGGHPPLVADAAGKPPVARRAADAAHAHRRLARLRRARRARRVRPV